MIEINLLAENLRKEKKKLNINIPTFPQKKIFKVLIGTAGILIIIHVLLTSTLVVKKIRLLRLTKHWEEIKPIKQEIDILKKDMNFAEDKIQAIEQLTTKTKIIWSEKFNLISNVIPDGVWLRRIFVSGQDLEIEGSAVSKSGEEMIAVGKFANNLKKEDRFYFDFKDIEVTSIKRRKIGSVEIVDFIIVASLKKDLS